MLLPLLFGTAVRLHGLGAESLWLDEATSILLGKADIPTLVRTTAQDIHPPLYYILLHFWLRIGDSEFIARTFSAFIGVLSIALIYQLGAKLFDTQAGIVGSLLLAVSPLHVWYSQETRMYVLVTFLAIASSLWLWQALQQGRRIYWLVYAITGLLGLYTHYYTIFVLFFQSCFAAIWWIAARNWISSSYKKQLWRDWLLSQIGLWAGFLPWMPILWRQVAQGGGDWVAKAIGQPSPKVFLETWIDFSVGNVRQWYPIEVRRLGYGLFAIALIAFLWVFQRAWQERNHSSTWKAYLFVIVYLGLPLGTVWLVSQIKPMYAQRYLLPFLPAYLLLVAAGIRAIQWSLCRIVLTSGLITICLIGVALASYYPQKDDWRSTTRYILQKAEPGDIVVLVPFWNFKPFDYYGRGRIPTWQDLPVPIPQDADVASLLDPVIATYSRIWLIWSPEHYADPDGLVQRYLESKFPLLAQGDFPGVGKVTLYQNTALAPVKDMRQP